MPQPTPYTPTTDFSQQEANNASGRSTVNTTALDAEFANIEHTVDGVCANLALLQRDDGRLKDLACELHTLSPEVLNLMGGFNLRGLWAPATAYAVNDIASSGPYTYVCTSAHTSGGSFNAQFWIQFGFTSGADAAQAAAAAQVSATNAAASATSASESATTATTQATNAAASATSASGSATTASTQAGNASTSATNAANSASAAAASAANLPNATTAGSERFLRTNTAGNAWEYQTVSQARAALGLVIGTDVQAFAASATQAEMEAGTETAIRAMTPQRVAQAIAARALIGSTTAHTGAYTVVATDRGRLIDATSGTWTLTLTAAATLGAGFAFAVRNSGAGTITIDPNASELIDGASTLALTAGQSCLLVCNGTAWRTVGLAAAPPSNGRLLRITRYTTAGSGTWTRPGDTVSVLIRAIGGGGGGGGVAGGGSGGYGESFIASAAASYAYVVGSGGAVGANGGNTTIAGITAGGGGGAAGGGAGGGTTGAQLNIRGGGGSENSGGGAGVFGGGGSGSTSGAGGAGVFGGGGGAGGAGGGAGGAGYIEIWEFA